MSSERLEWFAYAMLALGAAVGQAFLWGELRGSSDPFIASMLVSAVALSPYLLAVVVTRRARRSLPMLQVVLAAWVFGVLLSTWMLVDAILLSPRFLSGIVALILPALQLPAVAVFGLVVWALTRRSEVQP